MSAEIEHDRTPPDTGETLAAIDALCRAHLARRITPEDLRDGLRVIVSSPPELIEAAISYCTSKGWIEAP